MESAGWLISLCLIAMLYVADMARERRSRSLRRPDRRLAALQLQGIWNRKVAAPRLE